VEGGGSVSTTGLVLILFTDLVDSTRLTSDIGDVAADELRRRHFTGLREALAATGGTEVKTIGDSMMVSFTGAADAMAGAVGMQWSVARHNRRDKGPPLAMRIGISAGDATFEDGDWFGTRVIEASRLCGAADGGQILVSDLVRGLAGSRTDYEVRSLGVRELKGFTDPVAVSEVVWSAAMDDSALPLPEVVETAPVFAFAGRTTELDGLLSAWKEVNEGDRRLVLISGEPGVGKTRLVSEAVRVAYAEGANILWGRCDPELAGPFEPFAEALGRYTSTVSAQRLRVELGPLGGELTRLLPELADRVAGLAGPLRAEPDAERHRLFEAVTDLLAASSDNDPLVLVLDDLHWADKPSLLLLRHVLRSATPSRVLILATYRDTDLDRSHPLADLLGDLRRERGVTRLDLMGLDAKGVEQLMESAAGHDLSGPGLELARAVHAETEGNPFFVSEMLLHLAESGLIVQRGDRWAPDAALADVGIPEGIREVVGRRLSRLSEVANDALSWAAVIGTEFDLAIVEAAGGPSSDELLDALDEATRIGVLREVAGSVGRYRFAHALVRSSLHEEISTNRRVRMHWSVGEAIEGRRGHDDDASLDALAYHYGEGALAGDPEKAVAVTRRAAIKATRELAFEAAAGHLERAIGLVELFDRPSLEVRCDLLLDLATALRHAGDPRRREVVFAAADVARTLGDADRLARAALILAPLGVSTEIGFLDGEALDIFEEALASVPDEPSAVRARLLSAIAVELQWGGDIDRRRQLASEALEMARAIGHVPTLNVVLATAWAALDGRRPFVRAWFEINQEALRAAEREHDLEGSFGALTHLIGTQAALGDVAAALARLREAERMADGLRLPFYRWTFLNMRAMFAVLTGDLDEGERDTMEAIEIGQASDVAESMIAAVAGGQLLAIRLNQGRIGELVPALADLVRTQPGAPGWRLALGAALVRSGHLEQAREPFDWLTADDCARVPTDIYLPSTLLGIGLLGLELGADSAVAASVYDQLLPHAGTCSWGGVWVSKPIDHGLACAAFVAGEVDLADRHFAASVELSERMGARPDLAWTHHDWAVTLAARGRTADAKEHAETTRAIAEEVGMLGPDGPMPLVRQLLGD
jgi:class 3 adenylate cyclase/tetratricopeptide (TPR) repeat protein